MESPSGIHLQTLLRHSSLQGDRGRIPLILYLVARNPREIEWTFEFVTGLCWSSVAWSIISFIFLLLLSSQTEHQLFFISFFLFIFYWDLIVNIWISIWLRSLLVSFFQFNTPDLRVGTLDSLLSLSDDLLKVNESLSVYCVVWGVVLRVMRISLWNLQSNSFVEGVTHKIRRQIEELERGSGGESNALTVDGVPVDSYLTR